MDQWNAQKQEQTLDFNMVYQKMNQEQKQAYQLIKDVLKEKLTGEKLIKKQIELEQK